jgi:hypothetical protein
MDTYPAFLAQIILDGRFGLLATVEKEELSEHRIFADLVIVIGITDWFSGGA